MPVGAWNGDSDYIKGGTDDTSIGNFGNHLLVDHAYSSKNRVDMVTSSVTLVTSTYTTCYSYSGSGYLIGFSAEFNSSSVLFRLQIDGETVIAGTTLSTLGTFLATANSTDRRQSGSGIVVSGANIDFSLRSPIRFSTSVNIAADANGGGVGTRSLSLAIIYLEKLT